MMFQSTLLNTPRQSASPANRKLTPRLITSSSSSSSPHKSKQIRNISDTIKEDGSVKLEFFVSVSNFSSVTLSLKCTNLSERRT